MLVGNEKKDFLSWVYESVKDTGKKGVEVGLDALSQLNRPLAGVVSTVEEVGKGVGRTAGAVSDMASKLKDWSNDSAYPKLGEAFTKEERDAQEMDRGTGEIYKTAFAPVAEVGKAVAKTAIAPVKGFVENPMPSEIIKRNLDLTKAPSILEADDNKIQNNINEFEKLRSAKTPEELKAHIADLKSRGGLEVNSEKKDDSWTAYFKDMATTDEGQTLISELVGAGALTIDPLLYGAGIGSRTKEGVAKFKAGVQPTKPTLLGELSTGDRTAVKLGRLPESEANKNYPSLLNWLDEGLTQPTRILNTGIDKAQGMIDKATQKGANALTAAIDFMLPPDAFEAIDSVRKALTNRSANPHYNKMQETMLNSEKARLNTAEDFIKYTESQINYRKVHHAMDESYEEVTESMANNLLQDVANNVEIGEDYIQMGGVSRIASNPDIKIVDVEESPFAVLYRALDTAEAVPDEVAIQAAIETGMDITDMTTGTVGGFNEEMLSKNFIREVLERNGYATPNESWDSIFNKVASDTVSSIRRKRDKSEKTLRSLLDKFGAEVESNLEYLKNYEAYQGYNRFLEIADNASKGDTIGERLVNSAAEMLEAFGENTSLAKELFFLPSKTVSPSRFFKNLLAQDAIDSAKKYKYDPEKIIKDTIEKVKLDPVTRNRIGFGTEYVDENMNTLYHENWIQTLNNELAQHEAFKDVATTKLRNGQQGKEILLDDPVRIIASTGLGLGAKEWENNILSFLHKELRENTGLVKLTDSGVPDGYTSLSREGFPELAVENDLYSTISDSLGKIKGTGSPDTQFIKAVKYSDRLWKKSVLGGLFGEGYGYAIRNITSETLKMAQGGINGVKEMLGISTQINERLLGWARKYLPNAVRSVIDNEPYMITLPIPITTPDGVAHAAGETIDAFKLARDYSVIGSGLFEEEVMRQGGKISDKIKIQFHEPTLINKAKMRYNPKKNNMDELFEVYRNEGGMEDRYVFRNEVLKADIPANSINARTTDGKLEAIMSFDGLGANSYASNSEDVARLTTFAKALEDGYTPEGAAKLVGEVNFNYRDLSPEAKNAKLLMPFLTFYLKNLPFQIGNYFANPKVHRLLSHGLELALPTKEELEKMPDYEKERLPLWFLGGSGGRQYIAQLQGVENLGIVADWFRLMSGSRDNKFWKSLESNLEGLVSALHPALKIPVEYTMGRDVPGTRTTPLGDSGGQIIGLETPIQRYAGESAKQLPYVSRKTEHAIYSVAPITRKIATIVNQAKDLAEGTLPKEEYMENKMTNVPLVNTLVKYVTGLGSNNTSDKANKRRARFEKQDVIRDIRGLRKLGRNYKKQYRDGMINKSTLDNHITALKQLERDIKATARNKKVKINTDDAKLYGEQMEKLNLLDYDTPIDNAENDSDIDTSQLYVAPETPVVESISPFESWVNKGIDNNLDVEYNSVKQPKTGFESWIQEDTMPISNTIDKSYVGDITNHGSRKGTPIDKIVLHSTGSDKAGESSVVNWFKNPSSQVSAHYLITEDGRIIGLVDEDRRAWHAGKANSSSIGIEVQGRTGIKQYNDAQKTALSKLIADIRNRYGNLPLATHSDFDKINKGDDPFLPAYRTQALGELEEEILKAVKPVQ